MNILHIYSDWKWTGPSEPIFNLCSGLKQQGHNVFFACLEVPDDVKKTTLPGRLHEKGMELVPLRSHAKLTFLFALVDNINRIEKFISKQGIEIMHVHSSLDHFIAAKAVRHLQVKPKIVYTNHKGIPILPSLVSNWLIKQKTDGYITLSKTLLLIDRQNFNLPIERSWLLEGTVDINRFNPANVRKNIRFELNINSDDIMIGVVARVQRHRRFEIILSSFARLIKEFPTIKLMVIGRGTYQDDVLANPAKEMGLERNIIHIKQRLNDDDYLDYLAMMDLGVFLVPGSDGSCRAVREMMAMGKPVIVSMQGILPELIEDKVTGLVIDDTAENLVQTIRSLITNHSLIIKYGTSARNHATTNFDIAIQVKHLEEIYQALLAR